MLGVLNDDIADGRDVSWIWDADFELLAGRVRRVTCSGTRAAELAVRLKYAGVEPDADRVQRDLGRPRRGAQRPAAGTPRARAAVRAPHLHRDARPARAAGRAGRDGERAHVSAASTPSRTLRVCALYPDLMNIYADRGNLLVLERRCAWRGIGFAADAVRPRRAPGRRRATTSSTSAAARTATSGCAPRTCSRTSATRLHAAAARGAVVLGVCGGYQLLGPLLRARPGRGVPGRRAARRAHRPRATGPRLIGNVAIEVALDGGQERVLAGFENHGGRTRLGAGPSSRSGGC